MEGRRSHDFDNAAELDAWFNEKVGGAISTAVDKAFNQKDEGKKEKNNESNTDGNKEEDSKNRNRSVGGDDDVLDKLERQAFTKRQRTFKIEDKQKGIAATRLIRALAFAGPGGSPEKMKFFLQKTYHDDLGDEILKSLIAGNLTQGGAMVIPEYSSEIIELLRARTVVRAAGPRTVPLNGTLTFRRQTGTTAAAYIGEVVNIPASQPSFDELTLVERKLAGIVPISNDLIKMTAGPSADEFARDDIVRSIAIREDRAFLRDDGTQFTPRGLRYQAAAENVMPSAGNTLADIEEDLSDMMDALESSDLPLSRPAWFMHPSKKNYLLRLRDPNSGVKVFPELAGPAPTLYGYPVFTTTSLPRNLGAGNETEIIFAEMSEVIIGESESLEIVVDSTASYIENGVLVSAFSRDETLIRAIMKHDIGVRHRNAVAVKHGVTWGA